jgi:hypothetical protein
MMLMDDTMVDNSLINRFLESKITKSLEEPKLRHGLFLGLVFISTIIRLILELHVNYNFDNFTLENLYITEPNCYRLFVQFLLFLHNSFGINLFFFSALIFVTLIITIYFSLQPTGKDYFLLLLIGLLPMPFQEIVPLFLLFILVKNSDNNWVYLLLIPLALTKEVMAWVGFWFLFLTAEKISDTQKVIISGFRGASAYVLIRLIIGERGRGNVPHPLGAPPCPFFSPPHWIKLFLTNEYNHTYTMIISTAIIIVFLYFFVISTELDLYLFIIAEIPILLFACFFLMYLYFPVSLVILTNRMTVKKRYIPLKDLIF